MTRPEGIRIHHKTKRFGMATVECYHKPIMGLRRLCPTCNVIHRVKTVHLWLDATGSCIVSEGVLKDLQQAGFPDLEIVATIVDPPTIRLQGDRLQIDQANSRIRFWKEPTIV